MHFQSFIKVAPFAMMMAFNGCGGSGTAGQNTDPMNPGDPGTVAQSTGYLELSAAKGASREYSAVNLNVKLIEVLDVSTNKWITLCAPNRTIDIMSQSSIDALLAAHVQIAAGHYTKLRLILGDGGSIQLGDGSSHSLNLSTVLQAGIVLDVDLTVKADATIKAFLDLDLNSCIQAVITGSTTTYYLRPLFRVVDRTLVGSITGTVKARVAGTVLAGALVSAEWFDAAGRPHIELTVAADINGHFNLDRLTLGRKYHIVCRPQVGGVNYDAYATAELDLSAAVSLAVDLNLEVSATASGSASGKITPTVNLDASDRVELVQFLTCGAECNKWFIVASTCAKLAAQEDYSFSLLAQGRYAIQTNRENCGIVGPCSWNGLYVSSDLNISAGLSLNLDILLGL